MTVPVRLREVRDSDLPIFFNHQQELEAVRMAAFTHEDPSDHDAFTAHWTRIRANDTITLRTVVLADGASETVVGHVACFYRGDDLEVTYWIGQAHWGRGVATAALSQLLAEVLVRPMHARVAHDNRGSIRVLEKCGFNVCRQERGFAHARGEEIDELVMRLE